MELKELEEKLKEKTDIKFKLEMTYQQIVGQVVLLETLIEEEKKKEQPK